MKSYKYTIAIVTLLITSFNGGAADFSAPLIDLPKVKQPQPGRPLRIKAIVDDDNAIDSVKLYFRAIGKSKRFTMVVLEPLKINGKVYGTELPPSEWNGKGLEYYVEARDVANNVAQEPFPNKPVRVLFRKQRMPITGMQRRRTSPFSLGAGIALANLTIEDPDGDTGSAVTPSVSAIFAWTPLRNWRLLADLNIRSFRLPYSQTEVGQDINSLHVDVLVQNRIRSGSGIQGWLGAGIGLGSNKMSDRSLTDANGRRDKTFPERSSSGIAFVADMGFDVLKIADKKIGIQGRIYHALKDDVAGGFIGIYFLFNR